MALLAVANLTFSIGERVLLDGINITLEAGEHVGMVGRNGCGKSTLMKLMAGIGEAKPDTGQVQAAREARVGYLSQHHDLDPNRTLREEAQTAFAELLALHKDLEALTHEMTEAQGDDLDKLMNRYQAVEEKIHARGGYAIDHKVDEVLHGVGLTDEFFNVPVSGLSGGQKGRLALAKLLLTEPDVLLLDEPTNHLDISGRQWLEGFLATYRGAVLLVSHDRWLLDRVVTKIYELHLGQMEEYPGNYKAYREQRALRRLTQQREFEKQKDYIKKEQAFIDRYRAGQRAAQAQGREKRLERYVRDQQLEMLNESGVMNLAFRPAQRCGDMVLVTDRIGKGYEGKPLFHEISLAVKRGDRIGVIGPNGAGKTTIVRCMLAEQPVDQGNVRVGSGVNVGYYRQTHEQLDLKLTVLDHLRKLVMGGSMAMGSEQAARDLAGAFLFSGQEQEKPLSSLSGGERSRAVLAGLMTGGHNLLVLDEPTNHLDIPSAERLEEALLRFTAEPQGFGNNVSGGGTLILISHDRMLLDRLVNQLLILDGHGNCRHFLGTYSEWVAAQAAANAAPQNTGSSDRKNKAPAPTEKRAPTESKPQTTKEKSPSASAAAAGARSALAHLNQEKLEQRLIRAEADLAEIDKELANPDLYRDGAKVKKLQDRRQKLAAELTPLEEEWARRAK